MEEDKDKIKIIAFLRTAIDNKKRLILGYRNTERIVEPQCLGINQNGNIVLRALQIYPGPEMDKLFTIGRPGLDFLIDNGNTFTSPGPRYRKGDSAMHCIFCEL
jgi:hypothetical protein